MPRCSQSSRCAKLFVNICFFPVASATLVAASMLVITGGRASSQLSSEQAARSVAWPGCCLLTTLDRLRCFFVGGAVITAEGSPRACSVAASSLSCSAVCSVASNGWARTQVGFSVTCVICCTGCSVAPTVAAPQTEANYQLLRRRRSLSSRSYSIQETRVL